MRFSYKDSVRTAQSTDRNPDTNKLRNAVPCTKYYTSASRNNNFIGIQDPRGSIVGRNQFPNISEML
jgi:hypothetical protein